MLARTAIGVTLLALLTFLLAAGVAADETSPPEKEAPDAKEAPESKTETEEEEKPARPAAKDFTLPDLEDAKHTLSKYRGRYVVLEWINHGCPYVKKHYKAGTIQALQKKYGEKDVVWLSICSSSPGKQGHMTVEQWKKTNEAKKAAPTAVLLDPDGKVGRMYKAMRTPHMVVIDPKGGIAYEGAIDDAPRAFEPEAVRAAKNYVAAALDSLMAGKEVEVKKTVAYGCSVKY